MEPPNFDALAGLVSEKLELSLGGMAIAFVIVLGVTFFSYARWHYYGWRIERGLSGEHGIPLDMLNELERKQGDKPAMVRLTDFATNAVLGLAAICSFEILPDILEEAGLSFFQATGIAAAMWLGWRAIKELRAEPAELLDGPAERPWLQNADINFLGAIAAACLVVASLLP